MSYADAAMRARVYTSGGGGPRAQLVGNWIETFGPVVTAPWSESAWPETIVCDSKSYKVNFLGGGKRTAFTVLADHGYPTPKAGRLWL